MDEDSIRVLHFQNPHLLWVEVRKHDSFTLRQVGLFGVVPRQASLVDGQRVCTQSDRWDPGANEIVEDFIETKHQLLFKSTYRLDDDNEQKSIFYNQPHIFGEISLKKPDGSKKQLTASLDSSVYAYKSKNEFWQMLTAGKIETSLQEDEQFDVLSRIIQYYKDNASWHQKKEIFYQHLSPAQLLIHQELPAELTVENVEKHLLLTSQQSSEADYVIKEPKHISPIKMYQEFNCSTKPELAPVEFVENVIKKLTVLKSSDGNSKRSSPVSYNKDVIDKLTKQDEVLILAKEFTEESEKEIKNADKSGELSHFIIYKEELDDDVEDQGGKFRGRANSRTHNVEQSLPARKPVLVSPVSNEKPNEILVAYGPPISSLEKLVRKKVPRVLIDPPPPLQEDKTQGAAVNWKHEGSKSTGYDNIHDNVHKYNRELRKSTDSNDSRSIKDCKITGNLDMFDGKGRKDVANADSSSKTDDSNVNDSSTKRDSFSDLNEPKGYNDFIQSKQDRRGSKELPKLRSEESNSVDGSEKDKKDSNATENKDKNPIKNSRTKLLELMRKRKEMAIMNSSSSSNDNNLEDKETRLKNDKRAVKVTNKDDSDQKPNDTSSINASSNSKDSDLEELEELRAKLDSKHKPLTVKLKTHITAAEKAQTNANPYRNLDVGKSIFVDDLVQPLILAHSKHETKILPQTSLRDIPFKLEIHNTLRNKQVKEPNRLQSVSWPYILRGHSMVLISSANGGKTLGYVPAVCNLVLDYNFEFAGLGPVCIIVCATALSVTDVATQCRMFLNQQRVVACYPGLDSTKLVTDLVNGCDIVVSTPAMLCKLLGVEIGVDLRRLTTLVFEDCERLANVYEMEIKAISLYVKKMLKSRTDKQVKVQYILASRQWCDFMTPLARKAPDTIVTFAAFHECVLYSKTHTSVSFVRKENKVDAVVAFLMENYDSDRLTVIVCRSDDEVDTLQETLTKMKYHVVACNNQMDINDLYKLRTEVFSSILICCDANLSYLNVTYANYLVHYSMPAVYNRFCRRFAVLNDNYPSIFGSPNANVKIKILLEEGNVEQLPKILNFVRRCSSKVPDALDKVASQVLEQKDLKKAEKLVPICDNMLSLGECADVLSCQERHAILGAFDEPKPWMPLNGIITFKIIHYNTAIAYSARLLTHASGADSKKYPETYGILTMKLGMFFSKEKNKRLHGEPTVGDICAIAARKNFIVRCQVLKIIDYEKKKAKHVVINLIDEEFITVVRAVELYYLPEEFKATETYVVKVRLAGVRPQDKDVTFSELAMNILKRITDEDEQLYLRGRVVLTIGNGIFVDTLEACADLSALCETVVKYDFKRMLLRTHANPNPDHLSKLSQLCEAGHFKVKREPEVVKTETKPVKKVTEHRWAHLEKNDWSEVIFSNTINAGKFFVRPQKFSKCVNSLITDIKKYVKDNTELIDNVCVKDVVLAEFPDDSVYERAIVEEIIDSSKVKCFFVDNADWRDVAVNKLKPIPAKFIRQIPFQSIECRLIGIRPPGEDWNEFSTNWLHDNCLEDEKGNSKRMFVKYFVKEKAETTSGHKYGVILVDSTTDYDLVINKRMLELNLASVRDDEIEHLYKPLDFVREKTDTSSYEDDFDDLLDAKENNEPNAKETIPIPIKLKTNNDSHWEENDEQQARKKVAPYSPANTEDVLTPLKKLFPEKPIRSVPLVNDSDDELDKWDICLDKDLGSCFGIPKLSETYNKNSNLEIKDTEITMTKGDNTGTPNKPKLPAITDSKTDTNKHTELTMKTDHFEDNGSVAANNSVKINSSPKSYKVKRGLILKDVSYDSDDTSSSGVEVKKRNTSNNEQSVLDSDDTQSMLTEVDIDITTGAKKCINILDSDNSDERSVTFNKIPLIVELEDPPNVLNKTSTKKESSKIKEVLKTIPITQIDKTETATDEDKNKKKLIETDNENNENAKPNIIGKAIIVTESSEPIRTPPLVWRQNKDQVTIKIKIVVDDYKLESGNRTLKFSAYQNEIKYAFDVELYGLTQQEKTKHSNKGQYILVHLFLMMKKVKWLKLTTGPARNWIVYDVDSVDTSSDEETPCNDDALKVIMEKHERDLEVDDDDDDLDDTSGYRYKDY